MSTNHFPERGEIWLVNFDPTIGVEIQKKRPAVVVNSNAVGILPVKLIAPITNWQDRFKNNIWHIKVSPNANNGLIKVSAIDALQLRGVDTQRFIKKMGYLSAPLMEEVAAAIASIVEYQ